MDTITAKTMTRTGLTSEEIRYYQIFCEHAGLNDRVIMFDGVKSDIRRLLKNDRTETPEEVIELQVEETYDHWLSYFTDRGLISERQFPMAVYPILCGYTPFEDSEFYIAYRKEGDKTWNGRCTIEYFLIEREKMLAQGYEFRKP